MAGSINKVIIVGNLGADPEVRSFQNGGKVANLRIATSETWKDKRTGQQQERTEWHRLTMYRKLAEIAGEYLKKGSQIYVEGKLQTRKWQDQTGADRYSTEIQVNQMTMLTSRAEGEGMSNEGASNYGAPAATQPAPVQKTGDTAPSVAANQEEDDLPF